MGNPIPKELLSEFMGYCEHTFLDDSIPDGAWFQMLEDLSSEFMKLHSIQGDSNDAAHQLIREMN